MTDFNYYNCIHCKFEMISPDTDAPICTEPDSTHVDKVVDPLVFPLDYGYFTSKEPTFTL
jgi:hypothetical protein